MVLLGRIVAPYGIKGWVKLQAFGDDPLEWGKMPEWWLSPTADAPEPDWKPFEVNGLRTQGATLVASIGQVNDRDGAEALKGFFIGAPRWALPAPADDEHYWSDLTGMSVVNVGDERLGNVAGLLSTGAHDVLRVVLGDSERLIPFVKLYVIEVDTDKRTIRVDWQADW